MSLDKGITWIFTLLVLFFTAIILLVAYRADKDCEEAGGKRVRTTFSYECLILEKKP